MLDVVLEVCWMYVGCMLDVSYTHCWMSCWMYVGWLLDDWWMSRPTLWERPGFKPRCRLESERSGSQQVENHAIAAMYGLPY